MTIKTILLLAVSALAMFGQQTVDNSTAVRTAPFPQVANFPGACKPGDHITYTGASPYADYICNVDGLTWSALKGTGTGSLPSTTNILAGDSVGGALSSGIAASNVALINGNYTNPGFVASLAATKLTGNLGIANFNGGTNALNTTFWRGDGVWATPAGGSGLADPGSNSIPFRTSLNVTRAAVYTDIFALFTGCSGLQYPGFDGACHSATGGTFTGSVTAAPTGTAAAPVFTVAANTAVQVFSMALSVNVTSSTLTATNATDGQVVIFALTDSAGAHTFVWPTNVSGPGVVNIPASGTFSQAFRWDATASLFKAYSVPKIDGGSNNTITLGDGSIITFPLGANASVAYLANSVQNNAANVGGVAFVLDTSASTTANAFRVPVVAGATSTLNGGLVYDSTNNMLHASQGAADAFIPQFTAAPAANNNCVKWLISGSQYKLGDAGSGCGGAPAFSAVTAGTNAAALLMGTGGTLGTSGTGKITANDVRTYTVATLPTSGLAYVTDGSTATDCTVGGGSSKVLCIQNGTAWVVTAAAGSGTPAGSIGDIQYNNAGSFGARTPQGTGTKVQMAGTVSASAGAAICTDVNGNTTTTGCPTATVDAAAEAGAVGCIDTGTVNAAVCTTATTYPTLAAKQNIRIQMVATNTSTTPTVTVGSNAAKTITKNNGSALGLGDLVIGRWYWMTYNGTTFDFTTSSGGSTPNTTKGDLAGYDTGSARVPVGADGTLLTADSSAALGLSYQAGTILYRSTTDTLSCASLTTEQAFAGTVTIPASTLTDLHTWDLAMGITQVTSTTAPTVTIRLRSGTGTSGTLLYQSNSSAIGTVSTTVLAGAQWSFVASAGAGASVNVNTYPISTYTYYGASGRNTATQPVALATSSAIVVQPTIQCASTAAGATLSLDLLRLRR